MKRAITEDEQRSSTSSPISNDRCWPSLSDDDEISSYLRTASSEALELFTMLQDEIEYDSAKPNYIQTDLNNTSETSTQKRAQKFATLARARELVGFVGPTEDPDPEAMEKLIASEMQRLSLEERKVVYEDVHGVNTATRETPEAIANWIEEFREAVRKVRGKPELEKAIFLNQDYVMNPKNILMFLRSEDFDVKEAAQRMIRHYKYKLDIFGIDKLVKDITFDDLGEEDQEAVMTGFYQKLAIPDQSGRTVLMTFPHLLRFKSVKNQIRALWYLIMSVLQDDELAQRNGCVAVAFCAGVKQNMRPKGRLELGIESHNLVESIPFKTRGFHFCHDSPLLRPLLAIMQMAVGSQIRMRARRHYGSYSDCKRALTTFGIPVAVIPLDNQGHMNMDAFIAMITEQKNRESHFAKKEGEEVAQGRILFPSANDVLLGRGRPYQDFPGNLRLAELVEQHRPIYKSQRKRIKPVYAQKIVKIVKDELNGRFLRKISLDTSISSSFSKSESNAVRGGDGPNGNSNNSASTGEVGEQKVGRGGKAAVDASEHQMEEKSGAMEVVMNTVITDRTHWVEVDDEVARDKVSHSFRTQPKRMSPDQNGASSSRVNSPFVTNSSSGSVASANSSLLLGADPPVLPATKRARRRGPGC